MASELSTDGKALMRHVKVGPAEAKILEMMADRGGSIPWNWKQVNPQTVTVIRRMISDDLVYENDLWSLELRLTDIGRQVVDQIKKMVVTPPA